MQLTQSTSMRQEMRQLLTPRMIQSMEILQLPLMALEERIEQELINNPVLELREGDGDGEGGSAVEVISEQPEAREEYSEEERPMVVKDDNGQADDFDRLTKLSDYLENEEYSPGNVPGGIRQSSYEGERDKKLDAMNNTAAR